MPCPERDGESNQASLTPDLALAPPALHPLPPSPLLSQPPLTARTLLCLTALYFIRKVAGEPPGECGNRDSSQLLSPGVGKPVQTEMRPEGLRWSVHSPHPEMPLIYHPPALGLGSLGRVGLTQGLGCGAGPRWPPLHGEQLWVEVPRPLTHASGSEGRREAAAVAAGRRGSVEGVSRDQGSAGRRGCR